MAVAPTHNTYVFKDSTVCLLSITTLAFSLLITPPLGLAPRKVAIALWRCLCPTEPTVQVKREIFSEIKP